MLSGRELALEQNPSATGWVNQRIIYTHGVGVAMVPVNEVGSEGQPRPAHREPAAGLGRRAPRRSPSRGSTSASGRRSYIVDRRPAGRVRLPDRRDRRRRLGRRRRRAGRGRPGSSSTTRSCGCCSRARFRDLDLLISDQVTSDSQLLFHRIAGRPADADRAVPALRQGPLPRHRRRRPAGLHPGRVHDLRPVPRCPGFRPDRPVRATGLGGDAFNYIRNSVKITMDAYDGTMHFYVADPDDPIIRAYEGIFPTLFEPLTAMPADLRAAPAGARGAVQRPDPGVRPLPRDRPAPVLPQGRPVDRAARAQSSEQTLPSEAYYVEMHLPGETGVEFLLLQPMVPTSRPNMIAWVAARNDGANYGSTLVYRFPADTTIFGPAQIEARIDQDPVISAQISLWNQSGSTGHPRQPDRAAARRLAHLSPADLSPVDRIGVPGVHPDRRGVAAPGRLERDAGRCPPAPAGGRGRGPAPTHAAAITRTVRQSGPGRHADGRSGRDARRRRRWPACRPTCRASSTTPTRTSSWPSRRSATVTSLATARRSRSSVRRIQQLQVLAPGLALPSVGPSASPVP